MRASRYLFGPILARLALIAVVLSASLIPAALVGAAPAAQGTTPEKCARGMELFAAGNYDEALPLLEVYGSESEETATASPFAVGVCASFLANLYEQRGDLPAALDASLFSLKAFQQTDRHQETYTALFRVILAYHNLRQFTESREYAKQTLDFAIAQGNRSWQGDALVWLGLNTFQLGDLDRAEEFVIQARDAYTEANNTDGLTNALAHLGIIYQQQGSLDEATKALQQASAIIEQHNDVSAPTKALVYSSLSLIYRAQGQYEQSIAVDQKNLDMIASFPPIVQAGFEQAVLNNRATTLYVIGRIQEAIEDRLRIQELVRGNPQLEVPNLINLGDLHATTGNFGAATESLEQALLLAEANQMPVKASQALASLASLYFSQGRDTEALTLLLQANEQIGAVSSPLDIGDQAIAIRILNDIGAVYARMGQYDQALSFFSQSLEQAEVNGYQEMVASPLLGRGVVLSLLQRPEEALRDLEQALATTNVPNNVAVANQSIGDVMGDLNRLDDALARYAEARAGFRAAGWREGEVTALRKMARVYATQGRIAEALAASEEAMDLLEELRAQAGSEEGRAGVGTRFAEVYDRAAFLYHQQGDHTQAFLTVERGRARAFLDSLATGTVELSNEDARALFTGEREAYDEQQAARDALARARAQTEPDATLIADMQAQLERAEAAYADMQAQIAARGDQLAGLISARKDAVLTLEQVQARLSPGTTLVSYLVGEETSLAFLVTATELRIVELAVGRDDLTAQMAALHAFDGDQDDTSARLQGFYSQLIAPLELDAVRSRLLIIPHGVLHYLPFAALTPDGQRYLGDDLTISFLPAASVLRYIQEPVAPAPTLPNVVALANPEGPPSVEGVEEAARFIGQLFAVEPLLSAQATVANLQSADDGARVLHLGAHGSFNLAAPLESYLQLTPAGEDDGKLTVGEVYGLNLKQADLVVLSACETQVNQLANPNSPLAVTAGDELVGLQRAFFFAGAQNVVTTLWQVPDQPSQLLMERFYTHIRDGLAPANALQQAQHEVRAQYPNPRDWAGFVLSGVGATPLVEPPPWWQQVPWWGWALGGGAVLLAVVAGAIGWRSRSSFVDEPR